MKILYKFAPKKRYFVAEFSHRIYSSVVVFFLLRPSENNLTLFQICVLFLNEFVVIFLLYALLFHKVVFMELIYHFAFHDTTNIYNFTK